MNGYKVADPDGGEIKGPIFYIWKPFEGSW